MSVSPRRPHLAWILGSVLFLTSACASVSFQRDTATSGRFVSKAWAFTFFSIDLPQAALESARENASDSNLANLQVRESNVKPDFGGLNWILDIISFRVARVEGTWGYEGE